MGTGSSSSNQDIAADVVRLGKRFRGPSESGNEAFAELVKTFGRVNTNPKSSQFSGNWKIVYASGNSGLTALDGRIAKFTVGQDGTYENECTTRTLGLIPGYAKEGGKVKVTGGKRYELIQEYQEFKNGPGGVLLEEVEDPTIRTFEVLALDGNILVTKLVSTRFRDEDTGRMTTVQPDFEYYLAWQRDGVSVEAASAASESANEEEAEDGGGGLFGSLGTAIIGRRPGLATIAERQAGGSQKSGQQERKERQRVAAEAAAARRQEAEERKQRQQEERERRRERVQAKCDDQDGSTQKVSRGIGLGSLFGGAAKAAEEAAKETTETVSRGSFGIGGLFGQAADAQQDRDQTPLRTGTTGIGGLFGKVSQDNEQDRPVPAQERKRQQQEERERKRREAEERKQQEEKEKAEAAAARQAVNERISQMQTDTRDASDTIKELQSQLRQAQRDSKDAIKTGDAARQKLSAAEERFSAAETELDEANEIFNEVAAQLRDKQFEADAADKEVKRLEQDLVRL